MRTSLYYVFAASLLVFPYVSQGGCNVRSVQVASSNATTQAVNAITSAFAACTKCPCNVKVTSEAKVVADVRKKNQKKEKKPPTNASFRQLLV